MKLVVKMTTEMALALGCKFAKPVILDNLPPHIKGPIFEFPNNTFFIPIQNQPLLWSIDEKLLCEYH